MQNRKNLTELEVSFHNLSHFARVETELEGATVLQVVDKFKPSILIGLTGRGGVFNSEVLEAMNHDLHNRPTIFALSNPTSHAECTPAEALEYTGQYLQRST